MPRAPLYLTPKQRKESRKEEETTLARKQTDRFIWWQAAFCWVGSIHLGTSSRGRSFLPRLVGIDRWRRWPRNNARRKRNIYSAKRTSYSILILGQTAAGRVSLMWKNRINIRGSPMVLSFQDSQLWPPESFHHSHSHNVVLTAYLFTTQPSTPSENVQEKKMLGESLPTLNNGTNAPICQSTIYHWT
jgi:hypothetical protein